MRIRFLKMLADFSDKAAMHFLNIESYDELAELRMIALKVSPGLVHLIDQAISGPPARNQNDA